METVEIPRKEYENLVNQINILKDNNLLKKMNDLIDIIYEQKYGLYLGNYFEDLQEANLNNLKDWKQRSAWDEV